MAHFAKVNMGVVEQVIVCEEDFFDTFVDDTPGEWIQTSYNTIGGIHYTCGTDEEGNPFKVPSDDQSKALRYNYAGPGMLYDAEADAFYNPQPHNSWILDTNKYIWKAPTPYPTDGQEYEWDETNLEWKLID
jgi:hypothetical protein